MHGPMNIKRDLRTQGAAFIVIIAALTKAGKREMVRSEVSYWIFTS